MFYPENDYFLPIGEKFYTWGNLKSFDTKPVFAEGEIEGSFGPHGELYISFPAAKGYYDAASYNITVKNSAGKIVFCSSVISRYVRAVEDDMLVDAGVQQEGEYSVKITAVSPYAKIGQTIEGKVTVKAD